MRFVVCESVWVCVCVRERDLSSNADMSRSNVLQCVVVCCSAVCCIVLQCVAVRCSALQCDAEGDLCSNVL